MAEVIEKSGSRLKGSDDVLRNGSLTPLPFPHLCYLPASSGRLSLPQGELQAYFPSAEQPWRVGKEQKLQGGLSLGQSPNWCRLPGGRARVTCLLLERGEEGKAPKPHDPRKWG